MEAHGGTRSGDNAFHYDCLPEQGGLVGIRLAHSDE